MKAKLLFAFYQIRHIIQVFRLIPQIFIKHVVFGKDFYWKRYFWDRLGIFPKNIKSLMEGKKCIWIQAISEGDVISLSNFLFSIKKMAPSYKIIFSTNNQGSFKMLKKMDAVDHVIYFPWDIGFFCRRALNIIKPKYFVIIQHDYCLSFLKEAKKMGIKNILISGSIRPGEVVDYEGFHYKRAFSGDMFNYFDYLGVQSEKDQKNLIALGADPKNLTISGSLKMDLSYAKLDCELREKVHKGLGIDENTPVFLAGSTHEGDEEILIDAYKKVLTKISNIKLIIVPRYVERSNEILAIAECRGLKATVVHNFDAGESSYDIFIIKMLGILPKLYGIATVVFLGGSLIPRGGQNILEPMYHGKPLFFGPYMEPRKEFSQKLKNTWQGVQVTSSSQLAEGIIFLLNNPDKMKSLGKEAKKIVKGNQKALKCNIEFFRSIVFAKQ